MNKIKIRKFEDPHVWIYENVLLNKTLNLKDIEKKKKDNKNFSNTLLHEEASKKLKGILKECKKYDKELQEIKNNKKESFVLKNSLHPNKKINLKFLLNDNQFKGKNEEERKNFKLIFNENKNIYIRNNQKVYDNIINIKRNHKITSTNNINNNNNNNDNIQQQQQHNNNILDHIKKIQKEKISKLYSVFNNHVNYYDNYLKEKYMKEEYLLNEKYQYVSPHLHNYNDHDIKHDDIYKDDSIVSNTTNNNDNNNNNNICSSKFSSCDHLYLTNCSNNNQVTDTNLKLNVSTNNIHVLNDEQRGDTIHHNNVHAKDLYDNQENENNRNETYLLKMNNKYDDNKKKEKDDVNNNVMNHLNNNVMNHLNNNVKNHLNNNVNNNVNNNPTDDIIFNTLNTNQGNTTNYSLYNMNNKQYESIKYDKNNSEDFPLNYKNETSYLKTEENFNDTKMCDDNIYVKKNVYNNKYNSMKDFFVKSFNILNTMNQTSLYDKRNDDFSNVDAMNNVLNGGSVLSILKELKENKEKEKNKTGVYKKDNNTLHKDDENDVSMSSIFTNNMKEKKNNQKEEVANDNKNESLYSYRTNDMNNNNNNTNNYYYYNDDNNLKENLISYKKKDWHKNKQIKQFEYLDSNNITVNSLSNHLDIDEEKIINVCKYILDNDYIYKYTKIEKEVVELICEELNVLDKLKFSCVNLQRRNPIVTILGHVDHGKTTLLDQLRNSNIAGGEIGGITQKLGAFEVVCRDDEMKENENRNKSIINNNNNNNNNKCGEYNNYCHNSFNYDNRKITFFDTPGHSVFKTIRKRCVQCSDLIILVISLDDGIMSETIECIELSKKYNTPLIIAANKIDKFHKNIEELSKSLLSYNIVTDLENGDVPIVPISAKKNINIDILKKKILEVSNKLNLMCDYGSLCSAYILEKKVDASKGKLLTVICKSGILKMNTYFVIGHKYGKIKRIYNSNNQIVSQAYPSEVVQIISSIPLSYDNINYGDIMFEMSTLKSAQRVSKYKLKLAQYNLINRSYMNNTTEDDIYKNVEKNKNNYIHNNDNNLHNHMNNQLQNGLPPLFDSSNKKKNIYINKKENKYNNKYNNKYDSNVDNILNNFNSKNNNSSGSTLALNSFKLPQIPLIVKTCDEGSLSAIIEGIESYNKNDAKEKYYNIQNFIDRNYINKNILNNDINNISKELFSNWYPLKIINKGIGTFHSSDLKYCEHINPCFLISFNVDVNFKLLQPYIENHNIILRNHNIIYELFNDIENMCNFYFDSLHVYEPVSKMVINKTGYYSIKKNKTKKVVISVDIKEGSFTSHEYFTVKRNKQIIHNKIHILSMQKNKQNTNELNKSCNVNAIIFNINSDDFEVGDEIVAYKKVVRSPLFNRIKSFNLS
ncbi:translation initiation factor IF-2, putative [Plasmodium gaboni]|uniref:Translation initiation factor IF-2, putative n=1 Tax=Plasmodium gaboni TaxID=647221 RepID=A0ABY1UPU5_9APIC|nr:translation initiation factor IF-2, putative [Plasmodium gaboni]